MSQTVEAETPRAQLAAGSVREPLDVLLAVRFVPDILSPVEGKAPSRRRTRTHAKAASTVRQMPAIGTGFPPIEHDRPKHGFAARTADRAILVELRRLLAGIHAIWET